MTHWGQNGTICTVELYLHTDSSFVFAPLGGGGGILSFSEFSLAPGRGDSVLFLEERRSFDSVLERVSDSIGDSDLGRFEGRFDEISNF